VATKLVSKAEAELAMSLLSRDTALLEFEGRPISLGDVLQSFEHTFDGLGTLVLSVVSGQPRPYLDVYMVGMDDDVVVAELPPVQKQFEGTYRLHIQSCDKICELTLASPTT
jgi:hypothetical protein